MKSSTSSVARLARSLLRASLQAASRTGTAFHLRSNGYRLARALGRFHEGNASLDFNVVANQDFLLKRVGTAAAAATKRTALSASESGKDVVKVEASSEATLSTEPS